MSKKTLLITLIILLIVDFLFSTYQYYHFTICGDVTKLAAPIEWYKEVLNDPFGWKAIRENVEYGGAGRYMAHESVVLWFKYANSLIRSFVQDPVVALFLTSASFVALLKILFLSLVVIYTKVTQRQCPISMIANMLLSIIFIQYHNFYGSIGIIDRSISYAFFYGLPILLLALYFYPIYKKFHHPNYVYKWYHVVLLFLLPFFLAFHGPLVQPLVFIMVLLLSVGWVLNMQAVKVLLQSRMVLISLLWILVLCLYAFYVSKYNSEKNISVSLPERYKLLAKGIYYILSSSIAWPCIILGLGLNYYLIVKEKLPQKAFIKNMLVIIGLFTFIYLALLPLGGYRSYRPYIIRYDTLLPITLMFVFLLVYSTMYLIFNSISSQVKKIVIGLYCFFILVFTIADKKLDRNYNECQQQSMYKLYKSKDTVLYVSHECNLGTWQVEDLNDPYTLDMLTRMFRQWHIIKPHQVLK